MKILRWSWFCNTVLGVFSSFSLRKRYLYSKTCVKRPLSKISQIGFHDQLSLNASQNIAECSKGSILQYFRPSLSYHLSLRSFCLFLSGRFTQVLLYSFTLIVFMLMCVCRCLCSSAPPSRCHWLFCDMWL